ncbi:oxygen-regulated protein 1 isoform X3 [Dendropsophus ebraccatus]|uniref:oxygen-regulated protein 1 isoform X3 n=1 Tax=Dendropsophus ebraccatus TaxID=150705 RepID=UPI003831CB03
MNSRLLRRMSETTSTNISVAQANSTDSIQATSTRYSRMTDPGLTKRICFYKSGDPRFSGIKMVVSNRSFKTFDALLDSLSKKVPLPFGVRNITTPRGIHHITTLEELEDGKSYICSHQRKIKPINLERASKKPLLWQSSRPLSARRRALQLARNNEVAPFQRENTVVLGSSRNFVIFKNGDKQYKHNLVLNKKAIQNFDVFLDQISEVMEFPVFKLYSTDGRRILSTHALLLSSGKIVAAGREPFKQANYESEREYLPAKLPGISHRVFPKSRSKPEMKSPGKWKVSIITSDMPSAGTTSQVYIIFYGHLRASAPVFLSSNEEDIFQSGHEDTFDINIGDIGEVYKIRIGHTNSGDSPGWHCEEVQLLNIFLNEQFCIKVNRWLSRDEDDGEICREIPIPRNGHSKLPLTKYKIEVVTGDLWNAGTEANVYISLQGQYGDTGSRQLHKSNKPTPLMKGQTDSFFLEAVHLGDVHTIIMGHDGLEEGNGWYLDKVIVHDEVKDKEYTFLCYRWLDEGEEDGKIVRKLSVTNEADFPARFELEVKKKEMWTAERWKYQSENCVQFYCKATGRFIRLTPDGTVDALGDKKDKYGFFDVLVKRGKVRVFRSHHIRHLALAVDKGMVAAMDNSGILCELQLHVQPDRSVTLESTRMAGMTVSFNSDGEPADDDTRGYADIAKEFSVHVKGMFHSGAVLLLTTSGSQALCLKSDGSCSGAGKQKVESYWRVHKVGPGVCMFENVTHPRKFLRIKSGSCDGEGTGDEYCHFKVEKNYENGSVTLESIKSRGIYIGLLPNGFAKPMIHTGEQNVIFFPQVIKFGREKPMGTSATLRQKKEEILQQDEVIEETQGPVAQSPSASPPSSKNARKQKTYEIPQYSSNDWKVSILTGRAGTSANVILWVYGSKGSTGPITLGKTNKKHLFQPRQEDEFKVEIPNIGALYKIRIGHDGSGDHHEWELKQTILQKMKDGKTYTFEANRWLSKHHGNGDLVCELPVVEDGVAIYPVVKYTIKVYTGHLEQAGTEAQVYICLYGERGDSGKRTLFRPGLVNPFKQGQVDVFEIEAVSLGKLQRVLLGCEANHKSQYWYCEKVIIGEQAELSEYIFNCERWLPYMSKGYLHSEIELLKQVLEEELPSEVGNPTKANEGEWKITLVTGNFPNAGTDATVFLHVYGTEASSGPIILGSGSHQLFNVNSADTFQIDLKYLHKPYKIRIGHDNSGDDPDWYLEEVRLHNLSSDEEFYLPVNRWLGEKHDDGDTWREFPLSTDAEDPLQVLDYEIQVYTGTISDADAESDVYIHVFGTRGDSGKRKLHKSKFQSKKFQKGQVDIFSIQAVSLGTLQKIKMSCDGSKGRGWFLDKVIIQYKEDGNLHKLLFPCRRWFDKKQEDGRTERELFAVERENPEEDIDVLGKLWNIRITTANDSLLNDEMNVNVVIYGSEGKTNGFFLLPQKSEIRYFFPGSRDEFLVKVKDVGEIYKIRIVCDHLPTAPGWHLENIHMVEEESRQEVQFDCNCWMFADTKEEQVIEEFQVSSNRQEPIRVSGKLWNIQITTANDSMLSNEMKVNVIIYGSEGKTNGFSLPQKSEIRYFFPGSRDEFLVTIKDVGEIYKIRIVCDHLPTAPGWHLENIHMVEEESRQEVQFDCNCWIFADTEEEKVIKEFQVSSDQRERIPEKNWNIQITTANDSLLCNEMDVNVVIYGSDGKTNGFFLPQKSEIRYFFPGSRDEFLVTVKDVGEIYKIRIVCDHLPTAPGWHLESIHMIEEESRQKVQFDCNCWIFADAEEEELIKEFRVFSNQQELIPVNQYIVSVHTGDHWGAETLANVYITLYGERGDSGARKLHKSSIPGDRFTRNKVDSFELEAVSLGQLRKVVLGHDREGYGAGMYMKMVTIKESKDSHTEWVFPFWNWLDSHLGLCQTVCKLYTTGKRLSESPIPMAELGGLWIIDITGSGFESTENLNSFSVSFYGHEGKVHTEVTIDGNTLQVEDELQVGTIFKVQVSWWRRQVFRSWYLSSIHMKHTVTNQQMWLSFECWMRPNEDRCVESPALYPYTDPLPVVDYTISVHTGDQMVERSTGQMYICIEGEHGDTGKRLLNASDTDVISFTKGKVDVFTIKAVYLGQLQKIILGLNKWESDPWFLEKIIVREDYTCSGYTFQYNDLFTSLSGEEFTESEILLTDSAVDLKKTNSFNTPTKGEWQLRVLGTPTLEENVDLSVVVFGKNGKSSPQNLTNLNWDPILLSVGNIGNIIKASFLSMGLSSERRLHLQKIRMRDVDTKQEIGFYPDKVYLPREDGSEDVVEVAAVLPNQPPLEEVTYSIYIRTGDFPASSTNADVFITVYGENGDSCKRQLMHTLLPGVFSKGEINAFKMKAVDLGMLSSVHIEHNAVGYGAGWYLDQITIQASDKTDIKYLFPCRRWLDTAINDKQTGCELKLLGKFNRTNEKLLTSSEEHSMDNTFINLLLPVQLGSLQGTAAACRKWRHS